MPLILIAAHVVAAPNPAKAAKALAAEARRCSGKLTLTGEGVGVVRVGQPVETVRKVCHIARHKLKKGETPPPDNLLDLKIGPTPLQVEIAQGRVWRVTIDEGPLRTTDKLGVGSSLASLLASGPARAGETEGVIYASTATQCGMSFALSYAPKQGEDRDSWTAEGLAKLPPDTKVARILMSGCRIH